MRNSSWGNYNKLVLLAILFSVTGSGIVLFSASGISMTPMRVIGMICMFLVVANTLKSHIIPRSGVVILLLVVEMIVSTILFSPNMVKGVTLLVDYLICISIMVIIIQNISSREDFKIGILAFFSVFTITSLICVYEYITGNHISSNYTYGWSGDAYIYLVKAPTAFLYNPNNVGVLMVMTIPLLFLIPRLWGAQKRLVMFGLLVLDLFVIFMTGSRGAFLGGVLLIVLYVLFSENRLWIKVLFVALAVLIVALSKDFIISQISYGGMISKGTISIFGEGDGGRKELIASALSQVFHQNWLFGVGAGGVDMLIGMSVHNFIIEFLADFGIIGILTLFTGLFGMVKALLSVSDRAVRKELILFLLAFLMVMFIPPTIMTLHFVWVLVALVISYTRLDDYE